MFLYRFLYVVPLMSLLSACALFQPIYQKTAIDYADDCIAHEAQVVAPSAAFLEAAAQIAIRKCGPEVQAAEAAFLAQTRGDGRSEAAKLAELRRAQYKLARQTIALARNI